MTMRRLLIAAVACLALCSSAQAGGLYDIISRADDDESSVNVSTLLLNSVLQVYGFGRVDGNEGFTAATLLAQIEGNIGRTVTTEELADLNNIRAVIDGYDVNSATAVTRVESKVDMQSYLSTICGLNLNVEQDQVTETVWRLVLGIPDTTP